MQRCPEFPFISYRSQALPMHYWPMNNRDHLPSESRPNNIFEQGHRTNRSLCFGERQVLHHDHAGDAAREIDPEERDVDAAPARAAGGALAGDLIGRDEEAKPPLFAAVRDAGEVGAAPQRALVPSSVVTFQ